MAKKSSIPKEEISEDIVDQELTLPIEEEITTPQVNGLKPEGVSVGHPSRDFRS